MINLLPVKEKRVLQMEIVQKKVLLITVFVFLASIFLVLLLFALKTFTISKIAQARILIAQRQAELSSADFEDFKQAIIEANQGLAQIRNFRQKQISFTEFLQKISAITPNSIYFTNFSFKKGEKNEITIAGFSQTRGALFFFKQNVEAEPTFKNVSFPPSAWVKPVDVTFSFSLEYQP